MAYLVEIDVKKMGHHFLVGVDEDTGRVEVAIDGGEPTEAKGLIDGKVIFYSDREITVKDTIQLVRAVELTAANFQLLKSAQDRVNADREAEKSRAKKAAADYRKQIQRWKQKIQKRKLADKSVEKYCVHDISIGADRYSFLEHIVPGAEEAVVINPNYRIDKDLPGIGGRVARHGELIVWEFWEESKGWYVVRELTFNEKICVTLIYDYGYFARGTGKKRRMSLWRLKKESRKQNGGDANGNRKKRSAKKHKKDGDVDGKIEKEETQGETTDMPGAGGIDENKT